MKRRRSAGSSVRRLHTATRESCSRADSESSDSVGKCQHKPITSHNKHTTDITPHSVQTGNETRQRCLGTAAFQGSRPSKPFLGPTTSPPFLFPSLPGTDCQVLLGGMRCTVSILNGLSQKHLWYIMSQTNVPVGSHFGSFPENQNVHLNQKGTPIQTTLLEGTC